ARGRGWAAGRGRRPREWAFCGNHRLQYALNAFSWVGLARQILAGSPVSGSVNRMFSFFKRKKKDAQDAADTVAPSLPEGQPSQAPAAPEVAPADTPDEFPSHGGQPAGS